MNVTVLISCMHQSGHDIIARSNIQTDVIVVNQCDIDNEERFTFVNKKGRECSAIFYSTAERGLSKSRNRALDLSTDADVCIICDDDELFPDNYEEFVSQQYENNKDLDVATFAISWDERTYPSERMKMNFNRILRTSSQQITFKRISVVGKGIRFDEKMGSGTGNGGGEENKFLLDCYKKGLKMEYFPDVLATINKGESQWFHGYTERFFQNQGWSVRRLLGNVRGYAYIWFYVIKHHKLYKKDLSFTKALKNIHKGFFLKR